MNKREAVERFVSTDFNNIPLSLVEKAYPELYEKIIQPVQPEPSDFELEDDTEPEFYDYEPLREDFDTDEDFQDAVDEYNESKEEYEDRLRRWNEYQSAMEQYEYKCESYYPMWGTLFECDNSWLSEEILDNLKEVQDIGFIVLDDFDELNVCLGVAGAGYNFIDAHFEPLYNLLGLCWHSEE